MEAKSLQSDKMTESPAALSIWRFRRRQQPYAIPIRQPTERDLALTPSFTNQGETSLPTAGSE
jgi:hypothetical protein